MLYSNEAHGSLSGQLNINKNKFSNIAASPIKSMFPFNRRPIRKTIVEFQDPRKTEKPEYL